MKHGRRDLLRLGALFVPAMAAPRVAYSFLWAPKPVMFTGIDFAFTCSGSFFSVTDSNGRLLYCGHYEGAVARIEALTGLSNDDHIQYSPSARSQ